MFWFVDVEPLILSSSLLPCQMIQSVVSDIVNYFRVVGDGFLDACKNPKPANLIICTGITLSYGLNISEALDIPCWAVKVRSYSPPCSAPCYLLPLLCFFVCLVRLTYLLSPPLQMAPDGITCAFAPGDSETSNCGALNFLKHASYWLRVASAANK